jgi:hypothetical protein
MTFKTKSHASWTGEPLRREVRKEWKKFYTKEHFKTWYFLLNIVRGNKSIEIKSVHHVTCRGKQEKHTAFLLKNQIWKDHLGDLDRGGWHKLEEDFTNLTTHTFFSSSVVGKCHTSYFRFYNVQKWIKRKYLILGVVHICLDWWGQ